MNKAEPVDYGYRYSPGPYQNPLLYFDFIRCVVSAKISSNWCNALLFLKVQIIKIRAKMKRSNSLPKRKTKDISWRNNSSNIEYTSNFNVIWHINL